MAGLATEAGSVPVDEPREPLRERVRDIGFWADWAAAIGLLAIVLVFGIASPSFLTLGNIEAMLVSAAILVVLAVGQAFVISTSGIDLSIASVMTFGAVVLGLLYAAGWPILFACAGGVLAAAAAGAVNGLLVAKGRVPDFVVTLGMFSAASGAALILSDGQPTDVVDPALLTLASGSVGPIGYSVIVAAVVAVLGHIVLFRTRFGVHVLATGGNAEGARAMGVRIGRVRLVVYLISGVLAGLAAILLVSRLGAAEPAINTTYLLNAIAAVVLGGVSLRGGRGSIAGPVLGALLLTALTNGLTLLGISQFYQPLAVGIVVVLAALLMRYQR
ncbi:monosaccharide ABC transporter membrane protein (CUT2 family) [Tamaricihabitans halophyticus]|uniref:Monosaccharide ABC transporter membrane protein (CUT2 family) n=1 Tax=Tamaricihabitans halophyticus TaxID=1262583 RepID=A0A4R2R1A6_9PSEU|nr:ABC transporter permease [Tamaricihabitans halophyticus]TCP56460.1 monosaccharide ABC transporter membrane protein (CUT2 family) [Tamaricihabitans halophyticus]